jgi:uncharacterized protein
VDQELGLRSRGGRGPRSPAFAWLTIVAGLATALALLLAAQRLAAEITAPSLAAALTLFYTLLFAPLALLAVLLGRLEGRPALRVGRHPGRWALVGLVCGVGGLLACVLYVWLHGGLRAGPPAADPAAGLLALGLAISVLQVAAEELLFRGWLLPAVAERLGLWLGVLISAAAFSAFHLVGGVTQPYSLVNLMLGGVWFALLACRSGGLVAPFAAHFGWNVAEDIGLGLLPNPGRGDFGSILDRDIVGPAWWGGSDEGLNASLAMTVVLVALILPLLASPQRSA